jgi:hypothetical protein
MQSFTVQPTIEWHPEQAAFIDVRLRDFLDITDVPESEAKRILNRALSPGLHNLEQTHDLYLYTMKLVTALTERSDATYWVQRGWSEQNAALMLEVNERYLDRVREAQALVAEGYRQLVLATHQEATR